MAEFITPKTTVQGYGGFLTGLLGKYAPQGSNSIRGGYVMMLLGALIYLAQGPVPALSILTDFLVALNLISSDTTGTVMIVTGYFIVTGRASLRGLKIEKT